MTSWLGSFPALRKQLTSLEVIPETTSTNDVLKGLGLAEYTAVITGRQSAGRGRMGRTWVLTPGRGLALSLLVPETSPAQQQWLPLVAGSSLVESLHTRGVRGAKLKWPNDVLVDERKLAGILCEVRPDRRVIVGIGINVDYSLGGRPSEEAVSLADFDEVSHNSVDTLLATSVSIVREFLDTPLPHALTRAQERVEDVLATLGREVSVHDLQGAVWRGVAVGLTDEGHLVVQESASAINRIIVASDVRHVRQ